MKCQFVIGQKVVCVDASRRGLGPKPPLVKNAIYTIAGIDPELDLWGNVGVQLVEVPPVIPFVGFIASRFRPLVTDTQKWLKEVLEKPPQREKIHEDV